MFGKRKKPPITGQRILIISDIHYNLTNEELAVFQQTFDQCWLLGDMSSDVLKLVQGLKCPVIGVCGNHDTPDIFEKYSFTNVHGTECTVNGIHIVGIQGASKYKNSDTCMLTQQESLAIAKALPKAQVLLAHDSPFGMHSSELHKVGLKGITEYLKRNKPALYLYGHHHDRKEYTFKKTKCILVYRFGIIEPDGSYHRV
jgi:predicted phosphodiesterase